MKRFLLITTLISQLFWIASPLITGSGLQNQNSEGIWKVKLIWDKCDWKWIDNLFLIG
jgi:hypothetical protein